MAHSHADHGHGHDHDHDHSHTPTITSDNERKVLLSFGLIKLVPGDPAVVMGGTNATAAEIDQIRRSDAHAELKRWMAGDHRPNNDLRPSGG